MFTGENLKDFDKVTVGVCWLCHCSKRFVKNAFGIVNLKAFNKLFIVTHLACRPVIY